MHKYLLTFLSIACTLFGVTVLPEMVAAQTATTTDGSDDTSAQRTQYIRGWRGQSSDMQQKIQTLGSVVVQNVTVPVLFGVELANLRSDFGDARSNGRTHIGNDLMAVKGTPIVSPTNAVVLRIGVGTREGNYVYTANPGGETFVYMHLDKFGEGVTSGTVLEKGSLIGYVGNTGNASGGAAHLHFEIHDSNGTAVDPYPRIGSTFTIQEKIQYLNSVLSQTSDSTTLAQLLVQNFRTTFNSAITNGITLPSVITTYMSSLPNAEAPSPSVSSLPLGDLALGSKGGDVVRLQEFLIAKNIGPQGTRLAQAGATGNFGSMTQAALIEYQTSMNIVPADGYYGAVTRSMVQATSNTNSQVPTTLATSSTISLIRDLSLYSVGEDVRVLQKFLNKKGYLVSLSGAGSLGNETTYFGQATQAAVIKFQLAENITPSFGYVGAITRRVITSLGM